MYLDWIAGIFELLGIYIVGNKNKIGFLFAIACNILWVIYVLINKTTYGLLPVVLSAFIINIRNYRKWSKDEKVK